jgi:hypothetical protein
MIFLKSSESGDSPPLYALGCGGIQSGKVPNNLLDVKAKGEKKSRKILLKNCTLHSQTCTFRF